MQGHSEEEYDPGLPARIKATQLERLGTGILRYESNNENRLFRCLHELERLQRLRKGDKVPAPAVVDVNFQPPEANLGSFGNKPPETVEAVELK